MNSGTSIAPFVIGLTMVGILLGHNLITKKTQKDTEEGQIEVMNQESEKIIKEAQQVIDEEFSNMQQRVEYLRGTRLQRPKVKRVNPRAAAKPRAQRPRAQRQQQRKSGARR